MNGIGKQEQQYTIHHLLYMMRVGKQAYRRGNRQFCPFSEESSIRPFLYLALAHLSLRAYGRWHSLVDIMNSIPVFEKSACD